MENYRNEKLEQYKNFLRGKSCAVLGIGVSNIPLIKFLLESGAIVTARDKKDLSALSENPALDIENLTKKGVRFVTGEEYLSDLSEQVIFKTPGLRTDVSEIVGARSRGAVITSEMEAFLSICPCRIIAVTGSDGKTTTTTLVAKILEKAGYTVHLGGNIGKPLLYETPCMRPSDFAVLELSSFQLHSIGFFENNPLPVPLGHFPDVAIVTNVSPNHLDWHTSYEEYADSKKAIFKNLACGGKLVTNAACEITEKFAKEAEKDGKKVCFFSAKVKTAGYFADDEAIYKNGEKLLLRADIKLPGAHNAENYMAAMAATEDFVSLDDVKAVASSFGGVEHRLEYTATIDGADYYNSSIDSSPSRTIAAVSSFSDVFRKKLVLIMGGYDKNIPYAPVGEPVCRMARAVFLCGATADKIEAAIKEAKNFDDTTEIFKFSDFKETIVAARKYAKSGDKVILTPASASFDLFKNFDERGKRFKSIVHELEN
ncbi:MAG: UDP-N-acetylmuramoyl-L-alanine--D-glutamate ligase [Clostridia bacterium]|nr:UDP-N-acetylmuramoyl-L-alanine--D-glutamate ligase [Clostridia bacterium]